MALSGPRKLGGLALGTLLVMACTTGGTSSPSATGGGATTKPASEAPVSAPPASASASAAAQASIGPAEQASLKLGIWLPNAASVAPLYLAQEKGYFKDEGLDVEVIVVPETRAAVTSGSVDVGILDFAQTAQAIAEGLDVQMASSYRCHKTFVYAVRPEIQTPADLSGKDILIEWTAGEPDGNARKVLLKEAGWDLDAISPPPNLVIIPGFSNAATKVFVAGKLYGVPVYPQTRAPIAQAGGRLILDERTDWPGDIVFANTDWLAKNPNTTAHLLRAIMRGINAVNTDPQTDTLAILKGRGVATENEEKTLAANPDGESLTQSLYCPNLYFDQAPAEASLTALGFDPMPAWDKLADIEPLLAAQESLGMTNELPAPAN